MMAANRVSRDRMRDTVVSAVLAALGCVAAAVSWRMGNPLRQTVGPGYVPAIVAVCLAVLAVEQTVSALRRPQVLPAPDAKDDGGPESSPRPLWLAAAALFAGSVWVWSVAGYLAGISSAVFGLMLIDGKVKVYWALLFAVLLTVSLWILFNVILKIDLG
jgi:hypothetical protein